MRSTSWQLAWRGYIASYSLPEKALDHNYLWSITCIMLVITQCERIIFFLLMKDNFNAQIIVNETHKSANLWVYSVSRLAWRMRVCSLKCYWIWVFFITCCCCYKRSNSGNKMKTFSFIGRMTWQFKTGICFPGNYPTRLLPREFYTCKTIYLTPSLTIAVWWELFKRTWRERKADCIGLYGKVAYSGSCWG